jgi:peptidoglycan/LPS O-acetylase OafA/YrhL
MLSLFPRLRRITSGATWIPEIDGLRFVAIFSVVIYHIASQVYSKSGQAWTTQAWYQPIAAVIGNGARGVELFFVISGFILGRPFARHFLLGEKRVSLGSYYLRRVTRLEPPYILNLLICTVVIYFYLHMPLWDLTKHFLASAIYGHDLIYRSVSVLNGVTWTLEIEIQFYLIVPLLVLIYRVANPWVRRGTIILAMLAISNVQEWLFVQALWDRPAGLIYSTVFFYLQYFLAGILLSDLYLTSFPKWRPSRWWDLASLLSWVAYFYFYQRWPPTWMPFLLIVVFIGAFRGICFPRLFRIDALALIGGMCYSIYLWHFFIIAAFFRVTKHVVVTQDYLLNVTIQAVLLLPFILFFSTLYYLCIERPCMDPRWPQKLLQKWKAAPEGTGAA